MSGVQLAILGQPQVLQSHASSVDYKHLFYWGFRDTLLSWSSMCSTLQTLFSSRLLMLAYRHIIEVSCPTSWRLYTRYFVYFGHPLTSHNAPLCMVLYSTSGSPSTSRTELFAVSRQVFKPVSKLLQKVATVQAVLQTPFTFFLTWTSPSSNQSLCATTSLNICLVHQAPIILTRSPAGRWVIPPYKVGGFTYTNAV